MATLESNQIVEEAADGDLRIVQDATCTFCGCVCDDIDLHVQGHTIVKARTSLCPRQGLVPKPRHRESSGLSDRGAAGDGREGIERAAQILAEATLSTDLRAQRHDRRIATCRRRDRRLDRGTCRYHDQRLPRSVGMAFQGVGEVTASLGEVRNRGDLIIFWGSNPAESHPRHFSKYSLMPKGMFLPSGAQGSHVRDRRRAKNQIGQCARISFCRSSHAKTSRRCGHCGHLPRASTSIRTRSGRNGHRTARLAGSDGPHEGRQVWGDLLWHGSHDDTRQACQQRSTSGPDPRHESVHPLRLQAEPWPRERDGCGQRRRLAHRLSVRREFDARLSSFQSRRIYRLGCAGPRRSRCRHDHRQRPDGQFQSAGTGTPEVDPLHRPWIPRRRRPRVMRRSPSPSRPMASMYREPSIAWTTCRSRCARPSNRRFQAITTF